MATRAGETSWPRTFAKRGVMGLVGSGKAKFLPNQIAQLEHVIEAPIRNTAVGELHVCNAGFDGALERFKIGLRPGGGVAHGYDSD